MQTILSIDNAQELRESLAELLEDFQHREARLRLSTSDGIERTKACHSEVIELHDRLAELHNVPEWEDRFEGEGNG